MLRRASTAYRLAGISAVLFSVGMAASAAPISALIVDGRNNHDWRATTPLLQQDLIETGLFKVHIATAPSRNGRMSEFEPNFSKYRVVILNYTDFGNGGEWPAATEEAFVKYVASGGGVVVFHAASSAFPNWKQYNEITGLGGWGGRDEHAGPYVYLKNGRKVKDNSSGPGGHHGTRHAFEIVIRDPNHPITKGLPHEWMHVKDELYDHLRGPARNLTILATAYSDPATGGSGRDEPVLFTIRYGKGRVFCTTLGHDPEAMEGVGFVVTLQRGAEWAATGRVTQAVPKNFPAARSAQQP